MPTGYTEIIDDHEDATFEQYVWRCARGLGPLLHMRDDSLEADIREPKENEWGDFYPRNLKTAKARLAELLSMSEEQRRAACQSEYNNLIARWEEGARREAEIDARYQSMREKVEAWTPPSKDHEGLKKFMLDQLVESRRFSGVGERPKRPTPRDWFNSAVASAKSDVDYYTKKLADEQENVQKAREWIETLKKSVPYVRQP